MRIVRPLLLLLLLFSTLAVDGCKRGSCVERCLEVLRKDPPPVDVCSTDRERDAPPWLRKCLFRGEKPPDVDAPPGRKPPTALPLCSQVEASCRKRQRQMNRQICERDCKEEAAR